MRSETAAAATRFRTVESLLAGSNRGVNHPKSAPERCQNRPKCPPRGVLGASWATFGALGGLLSAVGSDMGGPTGAKRG